MDSTRSDEEVTTEDVQAGVIRATFKSRSHSKQFKGRILPEPNPAPDDRRDRQSMDTPVSNQTGQS